jgi:adenylate kinase
MILFFGPQGSGKGAQADLLSKSQNWPNLSIGELLRNANDPEIHSYQQQGLLVPAEKVNEILGKTLDEEVSLENFILDGYPREVVQAQWLIDNCAKRNISIDAMIVLDVEKTELLKRLSLRGRHDDTPESIEKRLSIYYQESEKVMDFLKQKGVKAFHIDGIGTMEEVHDRVMEALASCKLV